MGLRSIVGFVSQSAFLHFEEAAVCAEILAVEHGDAVFVMFGYKLPVHSVALDVLDALPPPAGHGHIVNNARFLEGGRGTEFIVETGGDLGELPAFLSAK
jgi:hypothetical protein